MTRTQGFPFPFAVKQSARDITDASLLPHRQRRETARATPAGRGPRAFIAATLLVAPTEDLGIPWNCQASTGRG
jgi:hypothetical protein